MAAAANKHRRVKVVRSGIDFSPSGGKLNSPLRFS
jgi:hypothetical protein